MIIEQQDYLFEYTLLVGAKNLSPANTAQQLVACSL